MKVGQIDVDALEAVIDGIHERRLAHPILSMVATRTDSVLLAQAVIDSLRKAGFQMVREDDARAPH
jgi:hypothetical protein